MSAAPFTGADRSPHGSIRAGRRRHTVYRRKSATFENPVSRPNCLRVLETFDRHASWWTRKIVKSTCGWSPLPAGIFRTWCKRGHSGKDLYYRLNVVTITLPPLRQRADDIPILVDHFLKEITTQKAHRPRIACRPEVMRRFQLVSLGPANVREPAQCIGKHDGCWQTGKLMTENDLPERGRRQLLVVGITEGDSEQPHDGRTGEARDHQGASSSAAANRTHAAERLKISVRTLQRKTPSI